MFAYISVYWSLLEISEEDIKNGNICKKIWFFKIEPKNNYSKKFFFIEKK
jgi:hypothetical protein